MSPYATELAHARLEALRTLIDAMNEAETPDEKRRCAVAIFNAPDPTELDDEIELVDDDDEENADADSDGQADPQAHARDERCFERIPWIHNSRAHLLPHLIRPIDPTPTHHHPTPSRNFLTRASPNAGIHPGGMSEGCRGWLCIPGTEATRKPLMYSLLPQRGK